MNLRTTSKPNKTQKTLEGIADEIIETYSKSWRGVKKIAFKKALRRIKNRFKRDKIDNYEQRQITIQLLKEYAPDINWLNLERKEQEEKQRKEVKKIIDDIQKKLQSKVIKLIGLDGEQKKL